MEKFFEMIECLVEKAVKADNPAAAVQYAQAAREAGQAMLLLAQANLVVREDEDEDECDCECECEAE